MLVPYQMLEPETLRNLIEQVIMREGTDYGEKEHTLDQKVAQVMALLHAQKASVTFDPATETCNIVRLD